MEHVISTLIYKLFSLCSGTLVCYLGYKLFIKGIFESSANIDAQFQDGRIALKKASPGIVFVLLGSTIIIFTITRGIEIRPPKNTIEPSSLYSEYNHEESILIKRKILHFLHNDVKPQKEDIIEIENFLLGYGSNTVAGSLIIGDTNSQKNSSQDINVEPNEDHINSIESERKIYIGILKNQVRVKKNQTLIDEAPLSPEDSNVHSSVSPLP